MQHKLMINGLPGNMAHEVIAAAKRRGVSVIPVSCTGPGITDTTVTVDGEQFTLITPEERDTAIEQIKKEYGPIISIDYTHPTAVNTNGDFYIRHELPFIMGTTGGDREKLIESVRTAHLFAVISPNMAKQIVALQAMINWAQESFPSVYSGYTLSVVESHQSTKADVSGTAKAIVATLNKTGITPISDDEIEMVRDRESQLSRMAVPESALSGHAFHTYRLESSDKSVAFEFRHNVCGRSIYAEGTIDAALYLDRQISANSDQRLFTVNDILTSGAMQ